LHGRNQRRHHDDADIRPSKPLQPRHHGAANTSSNRSQTPASRGPPAHCAKKATGRAVVACRPRVPRRRPRVETAHARMAADGRRRAEPRHTDGRRRTHCRSTPRTGRVAARCTRRPRTRCTDTYRPPAAGTAAACPRHVAGRFGGRGAGQPRDAPPPQRKGRSGPSPPRGRHRRRAQTARGPPPRCRTLSCQGPR
jgi:hypothetical protein